MMASKIKLNFEYLFEFYSQSFTLAVLVHGALRRPHAAVQGSHADTFHVTEMHRLGHRLVIHGRLHGLKQDRETGDLVMLLLF